MLTWRKKSGSCLRLPTEPLRPRLQALLELVGDKSGKELAGDTLRLSRLEALRLGAALGAGARWLSQAWHLVVLDEAQNIKNANSHAAQMAGELNTRHPLCLSGTPMENHLVELWGLFHFLMPGFLGSHARFRQLFRTPIKKLGSSE